MERIRANLGELLRRSPWFVRRSPTLQRALVASGNVLTFDTGQWIYSEGDDTDGVWAVLEGLVRLELSVGKDRSVLLNLAGPGAFTGQLERPQRQRRMISARASLPTVIFSVSGPALEAIAARDPMMWKGLSELMRGQLGGTLRVAAEAIGLSPRARIASRLLHLGDHLPDPIMPLRQSDIAEMAGISRKAANYHLQRLRKMRAISLSYGGVKILDRKKLLVIMSE
jgi:CRP/FNR family cyclic AMP-dependent transcriptional regulator